MSNQYSWLERAVIKTALFINKIINLIRSIGATKKEYWYDEDGVRHTRLIIKRMK